MFLMHHWETEGREESCVLNMMTPERFDLGWEDLLMQYLPKGVLVRRWDVFLLMDRFVM